MDHWFEEILARYGQAVTVCRGEESIQVQAFFQPVTKQQSLSP